MRAQALDLVRLLLVALALQLVVPLVADAAPMRLGADGSWICVTPAGADAASAAADDPAAATDHDHSLVECVFCLPLVGGAATPSIGLGAPTPSVARAPTPLVRDLPHPILYAACAAAPRAPPAVSEPFLAL